MSELLSKQDVLDALNKECDYLLLRGQKGAEHVLVKHAISVIDDLPAKEEVDVIRCRECAYWTERKVCWRGIIDESTNNGNAYCSYAKRKKDA